MRLNIKHLSCTLMVLVGMAFLSNTGMAQKWKPFQFKGSERYEYKLTWLQDEKKEVTFIVDLKDAGEKDENGDEVLDVSFTIQRKMNKNAFTEGSLESLIDIHGLSMTMLIFNPLYFFVFEEIELKDGEKTNFAGMGAIKVTGKEKIAGREGFVCQFFQKDADDKDQLAVEWVIDPALGMPLRTKTYQEGDLQSQCELLKYGK